MKQKIACHIVAGFLGAGKTTLIERLLSYKNKDETWAVLVNESGRQKYSVTHALANQVVIKEVYGGCLCCSAGMPFRVALNKLIKEAKPQRIFIEPAGAGHLNNIKKLLKGQFYQPILRLQPTLCLLSMHQLSDDKYIKNEGYLSLIEQADLLCVNAEEDTQIAIKMAEQYVQPLYKLNNSRDDLTLINHG